MYPYLVDRYNDDSHFQDHCILSPLNTVMDELNNRILVLLLGNSHSYLSSDTFLPSNTDSIIDDINPPTLLHGMSFLDFLNHEIKLKAGAPVVLLRNLNPWIRLYNDTRLIIERLGSKVVQAKS